MPFTDRFMDKEITDIGETVTVRTVTKNSYSDWGDVTESTSDTASIKAVFNVLTQTDDFVKEGIFKVGDILFFFKGNQSNITRGNRIKYNSVWYEMMETIEHSISGTVYIQVARVKKI